MPTDTPRPDDRFEADAAGADEHAEWRDLGFDRRPSDPEYCAALDAYAALIADHNAKAKRDVDKVKPLLVLHPRCVDHLEDADAGNSDPRNVRAALAAVRAGYPVSPCNAKDGGSFPMKAPLIGKRAFPSIGTWAQLTPGWLFEEGLHGGFKRATLDERFVRYLWACFPGALPMVAIPPGVVVIDVDDLEAFPEELLADLKASAGAIVKTPGGGLHFYFKAPKVGFSVQRPMFVDAPNPAKPDERLHVADVKPAGKGYAFAPGAASAKGVYELVRGELAVKLPALPAELRSELKKLYDTSRKRKRGKVASEEIRDKVKSRRAAPETAADGGYRTGPNSVTPADLGALGPGSHQRNNTLNEGVFVDAVYGRLTDAREQEWRDGAARCGMPDSEVSATIASAKAGASRQRPRTAPEEAAGAEAKRDIAADQQVESQTELARTFARYHPRGADFYYRPKHSWYEWSKAGWREDDKGARVTGQLMDYGERVYGTAVEDGEDVRFVHNPAVGGSKSTADGARARLQSMRTSDRWDADEELLGLPDRKVLDLTTGKVRDQRRADHITRGAGAVPADTWEGTDWERFIVEAVPDKELRFWLQTATGAAAYGTAAEEVLLFVYGRSGAGKGTFLATLDAAFGSYARRIRADYLMSREGNRHPEWIASLEGARVGLVDEVPRKRSWETNIVKTLVSGDPQSARFMRENSFDFTPQATLILGGQHAPQLTSRDTGMTRRLHVVPFNTLPAKPNPRLKAALAADLPAVLAWISEGAVRYAKDGLPKRLQDGSWMDGVPQAVIDATATYHENTDQVRQFLEEEWDGAKIDRAELFKRFKEWGEDLGIRMSAASFYATLREDYDEIIVPPKPHRGPWMVWKRGQRTAATGSTTTDAHARATEPTSTAPPPEPEPEVPTTEEARVDGGCAVCGKVFWSASGAQVCRSCQASAAG